MPVVGPMSQSTGRSASAAIRELSMSVLPATWSVAPAVSMIASATRLPSAMPKRCPWRNTRQMEGLRIYHHPDGEMRCW